MNKYTPATISLIREKAKTMTAMQLALDFGISKNAVIGLCRRQRIPLTAFANMLHPEGKVARAQRRKKKAVLLQQGNIKNTDYKPIPPSKVKLSNKPTAWPPEHGRCGYVIGEPIAMKCCGAAIAVVGAYYCKDHHEACYEKKKPRD